MITLDVNMSADKVQETLDKVSEALTPESCAVVAAEAGADVVRDWFVSLARSRHRPGQRLNFYLQAADSVIRETSGGTALIKIPHPGIAQRYYGGVIKPSGRTSAITGRPIKRIAIGLSGTPGEGHVPADFADLFVVVRAGSQAGDRDTTDAAFLARQNGDAITRLFILLSSVQQDPDPNILPSDTTLIDAATDAILDLYEAAQETRP